MPRKVINYVHLVIFWEKMMEYISVWLEKQALATITFR